MLLNVNDSHKKSQLTFYNKLSVEKDPKFYKREIWYINKDYSNYYESGGLF